MKNRIKLWLRRWAIRQLIKLADRGEDWLQAVQVRLRENLAAGAVPVNGHGSMGARFVPSTREGGACSAGRRRVSFLEWEARRSGVAVVSKKEARRRRERVTASAFDLRFAR